MPAYDINIYLANGTAVKIVQNWNDGAELIKNLEEELAKEECTLRSKQEVAMLKIKKPKDNVVGYFVDQV